MSVTAQFHFFGHYQEPGLRLESPPLGQLFKGEEEVLETVYEISFDLQTAQWTVDATTTQPGCSKGDGLGPQDDRYGQSHRNYCIDGIVKQNGCSREQAA